MITSQNNSGMHPDSSLAADVHFYLGTVKRGNQWKYYVQLDGTDVATQVPVESDYSMQTITANTRVVVMEVGGTYLIVNRLR